MINDTRSGIEANHDLSLSRLDDLLQRSRQSLARLPGCRSLSLFGSLAEERADAYSDIDMLVTTDDLAGAQAQIHALLEEIGPVEFCWAIPSQPGEWNATVVFCEESHYHRLDIALAPIGMAEGGISTRQARFPDDGPENPHHDPIRAGGAYSPATGSVGHFLLGQFLGGMRYVKARKRGRIATCYRFAVAAMDWRMRTCYACLTGDHSLETKLSTQEYAALDALLTIDQRSDLFVSIDLSTPGAMDCAMNATLDQLYTDSRAIAGTQGESLRDGTFLRMQQFIRSELGITG